MTNRLGRIIDRAHVLDDKLESVRPDLFMSLRANLAILSRRRSSWPSDYPLHHNYFTWLYRDRDDVLERLVALRSNDIGRDAFHRGDKLKVFDII